MNLGWMFCCLQIMDLIIGFSYNGDFDIDKLTLFWC